VAKHPTYVRSTITSIVGDSRNESDRRARRIAEEIENLLDGLSHKPWQNELCSHCGSLLQYIDGKFFLLGENDKGWNIPLPVCPKCDLRLEELKIASPRPV
jgi:hypothetical protein